MWQQTDPLVSPLVSQAPGSDLQRSGGRVRGNRPGSRTGLGQGIMRSIGGMIRRGFQNITREEEFYLPETSPSSADLAT